MANKYCRELFDQRKAEGLPFPVGSEALHLWYENSNPPVCFCKECKIKGFVHLNDLVPIEFIFDLTGYEKIRRQPDSYSLSTPFSLLIKVGTTEIDMLSGTTMTVEYVFHRYGHGPKVDEAWEGDYPVKVFARVSLSLTGSFSFAPTLRMTMKMARVFPVRMADAS